MNRSRNTMRVAIVVNKVPGETGGVAQSTQGLVHSLGQLEGPEQYLLAADTVQQAEWIREYAGPNQEVVLADKKVRDSHKRSRQSGGPVKRALRPCVETIRRVVGRMMPRQEWPSVAISDGYYESLGCDVLHFPTQSFVLCAMPTIFNPHDLQHLHYPQFWDAETLAMRETSYVAACHYSQTVVVGSEWIKQDVIRQYGVHPDKVQIVPWASPTEQYPQISQAQVDDAKRRLALPEVYALYPAVTWPHKNHLRLFDALAELRDRHGLVVNLVCTGATYKSHWPKVEERLKELNLAPQVRFLGFLSQADLRAVYRLAQFLVLPSLFEADSCPIHEAWSEGIPVASSNHTALPEQVLDAGLLFDAADVGAIADAVRRMATDARLREDLKQRGYRRVNDFSWKRTGKAFRAVYRRAAGVTLNEEDRWLLQWDWMSEPHRGRSSEETSYRAIHHVGQ